MGLRGIGAKPKPKAIQAGEKPARRRKRSWERAGLTRAQRVIKFIESLKITSGKLAGKPFRLRPWQREFIEAVYAVDRDGHRQVRTAVLSIGRKNGKTQLAAALCLAALCGPESESRSECYSCANDVDQASKIFDEMWAMIRRDPDLEARTNVKRWRREIEDFPTEGIFRSVSADDSTKMGLNPSFVCYDELGSAKNRRLFDAFDTAMGARSEPLLCVISTQADSDLAPMSELIDYGVSIQQGLIQDATFHLTLYTAPPELDPFSLEAWKAANPALGDFRSLSDVQRQADQAKRMRSKLSAFENLILNRRIAAEQRFVNIGEWRDNGEAPRPLDSLVGVPCFAGLDLGATRDLTGLVAVFGDPATGWDVHPWAFMPGEGLDERSRTDRVPYAVWRDEGLITAPKGTVTNDPAYVARVIGELHQRSPIHGLGYDRWKMRDLIREFARQDIDAREIKQGETFKTELGRCIADRAIPLIAWGQGFASMAGAVDALEMAIANRKLRHGNNPVLTWNAANAVVVKDSAGNRKLDKQRSRERIDLVVALAMALDVAGRYEAAPPVDYSGFLSRPVLAA